MGEDKKRAERGEEEEKKIWRFPIETLRKTTT